MDENRSSTLVAPPMSTAIETALDPLSSTDSHIDRMANSVVDESTIDAIAAADTMSTPTNTFPSIITDNDNSCSTYYHNNDNVGSVGFCGGVLLEKHGVDVIKNSEMEQPLEHPIEQSSTKQENDENFDVVKERGNLFRLTSMIPSNNQESGGSIMVPTFDYPNFVGADSEQVEKKFFDYLNTSVNLESISEEMIQSDYNKIEMAKKKNMRSNRRRKRGPEPSNSAIYYYRMDVLEDVSKRYPHAQPKDIIDIVQQQWDSLQKKEKEQYYRLAQLDQQRYNQEAKQFLPRSEGGTMKRPKRKKHPKAPKHPMSAYLYFVADYRPQLKDEHPDKNFTEIAQLLGEKWKTVVGKDREMYQQRAENDKKRYRAEKLEFEPSPRSLDCSKKRKKHPLAPKHPLSGYLYFVANNRAEFNRMYPDKNFTEVAKLLGEHWKRLSEQEKRKYQILAAADKKRYEEEKEKWQPPDDQEDNEIQRMPKKALTAYSFWACDERANIIQQEPNIDKRELTRRLRAKWSQLSPTSKSIYNQQAESDRQRYQQELSMLPRRYRPRSEYRKQRRQERLMRVSQEVIDWSPIDVARFLEACNFSTEVCERMRMMNISGNIFVQLSARRIHDHLGIKSNDVVRRMCRAIWILSL